MNQITFKTLDTKAVHRKLLNVADRLYVVSETIDKLNKMPAHSVLPVLRDAEYELGEVYGDLQLNGQGEKVISKEQEKRWRVEYMEQLEERLAQVKAEVEADQKENPH